MDQSVYRTAPDKRMLSLRRSVTETIETFTSPTDLGWKVAADLGRLARERSSALDSERAPDLVDQHLRVLNLMKEDPRSAERENAALLEVHSFSPRAHYNHACIQAKLSRLAPSQEQRRERLVAARRRLADALKYGIVKFIRVFDPDNPRDPIDRILSDEDLAPVFEVWPHLREHVRHENHSGFAAVSWCVSETARIQVDLNGASIAAGLIRPGQQVVA